MLKDAIIWRKSVYENGFCCTLCGTKLRERDPIVLEDVLFCPQCHFVVACVKKVDVPADASGFLGNLEEYERRRKNAE